MGLDTTHDCWHGPYSAFMRWREKLAEVAGYGSLREYSGFGEGATKQWPNNGDALILLLDHSDCDGELPADRCGEIADRLAELLPAMEKADRDGLNWYASKTQAFIDGLRRAAEKRENVEFH